MARPLRIEYEGAWYHIMNRGAAHQPIFYENKHYKMFIELLQEVHFLYGIEIHAYCLMNNHYHILLNTPHGNLSRAMRHLNGVYTQRYNRLTKKDGPLFRGRFKSCLIDADEYLLAVSRYIHLNPIEAAIANRPEKYTWSSCKYYFQIEAQPSWLTIATTLDYFSGDNQYDQYRRFIEAGITSPELIALDKNNFSEPIFGRKEFLQEISKNHLKPKHQISDIPQHKKILLIPEISTIKKTVIKHFKISQEELCKRNYGHKSLPKAVAIYLTVTLTKQKKQKISLEFDGISVSGVSHAFKKIAELVKSDTNIKEIINELSKEILSFQDLTL